MKLLIVEPEASGHRMALYARLFVREAVKNRWRVQFITTLKATKHPAFSLVEDEAKGELEVFFMREVNRSAKYNPSLMSRLRQEVSYYKSISEAFHKLKDDQIPDIIYMSSMDNIDKILSIMGSPFGSVNFTGMLMSVKHHRYKMRVGLKSKLDWLYEKLYLRILCIPTLKSIATIDESFFSYSKDRSEKEYKKVFFIPEVGDLNGSQSRTSARRLFSLKTDKIAILVYGSLTLRKGIETLLKAVSLLNDSRLVVILSGRQSEEVKKFLTLPAYQEMIDNNQLLQFNEFHDDEKEYCAFKAADVVWVGYSKNFYGSSGVLFQSCSASLPVIASSHGLIGWLTRKHQVGVTFEPENFRAASLAIKTILNNENLRNRLGENAKRLAEKHSSDKFQQAFSKLILNSLAYNTDSDKTKF